MAEFSTAGVRITQYLASAGISENEFRKAVGWSQGLLGKAVKRKSPIGSDKLERVLMVYRDINPEWLLTGVGTMHRIPSGKSAQVVSPAVSPTPESHKTKRTTPGKFIPMPVVSNREDESRIIMLDSRVAAGFPGHAGDVEFLREQPVMHLPGFRYKGQGLIALQVTGDSMAPTIKHEDWLVARPLEDPLQEIREGYVHLLVTQDGCVAKRLYKAAKGRSALLCKSDNEDYPPYEQPLEHAVAVYRVEALLSEDLSNQGGGLRERVTRVERDLLALKHQLKPT